MVAPFASIFFLLLSSSPSLSTTLCSRYRSRVLGRRAFLGSGNSPRSTTSRRTQSSVWCESVNTSVAGAQSDTKIKMMERLSFRMGSALQQLGLKMDNSTLRHIEQMSQVIYESMSRDSRNYHAVEHVFDVSNNIEDPIIVLAALFHDVVYYHVDGSFSDAQAAILDGVLDNEKENSNGMTLASPIENDELLSLVMSIFGFTPGQQVTYMGGLNEFLSAVLAVRELETLLPREMLAQIACCIEATIPFRLPIGRKTPADRLYDRLTGSVAEFSLNLSDEDVIKAVQRAVILSNEDIRNMGTDDQFMFLDKTWSLLPESNEALRNERMYTVQDYQAAMYRMYTLFVAVPPSSVFQQFRSVPPDEDFVRLNVNAHHNFEVGRKYVGAKVLSISVVAAFAELTGGDAPFSLFWGDLSIRQRMSRQNEWVPPYPERSFNDYDQEVYDILAAGRRSETAFDIRQSPLAAYLYALLGDVGIEEVLQSIEVYPMDKAKAKALLAVLPGEAVVHASESFINFARPRSGLIRSIAEKLSRT